MNYKIATNVDIEYQLGLFYYEQETQRGDHMFMDEHVTNNTNEPEDVAFQRQRWLAGWLAGWPIILTQ